MALDMIVSGSWNGWNLTAKLRRENRYKKCSAQMGVAGASNLES